MWTEAERAAIERSGRSASTVEQQVRLLRGGGAAAVLTRPCTLGDGIVMLDEVRAIALEALWAEAAAGGRLSAFVPASGAATRMFDSLTRLLAVSEGPLSIERVRRLGAMDKAVDRAARVLEDLPALALWPMLEAQLAGLGVSVDPRDLRPVVQAMCAPGGLASLPKALLPFHRYEDGSVRTPLEEHLSEALATVGDAAGAVRVHFTLHPSHQAAARAVIDAWPDASRFEVTFSEQDPSTDTVALQGDKLVLGDDGGLVLRPGGHGALLGNLAGTEGDVVLIKNIDNIVHDHVRSGIAKWRRRLAGLLVEVERAVHGAVRDLHEGRRGAVVEAQRVWAEVVGGAGPAPATVTELLAALERPIRVCGMVPHDGQPGGGPFWCAGGGRQIVEKAQVAADDPEQNAILERSSHFNPVDMAVSLRDPWGRPWDLERFTDPSAVILTQKLHRGRPMTVLELPGLWNGGMAGWISVFVHMPREVFQPVKTLADLLVPPHRLGAPL